MSMSEAVTRYEAACRAVDQSFRDGDRPPAQVWDEYNLAAGELSGFTARLASVAEVGATVATVDGPLIVASRDAEVVVLSADGQPVDRTWHDGDGHDDSVRYEVRSAIVGTRIAHGYVHPVSRKVVQTG